MLKNRKTSKFAKILCVLVITALLGVSVISFLFNNHALDENYALPIFTKIVHALKGENLDVDLVYLWCDGNDPKFREQKNYWLKQENKELDQQATADGRFEQVDELKYSLRSVEEYLPWIHHIYIITNDQIPSWLNTKNPKITIVDHTEILPKENLPVFNSNAIETGVYKIPGLAEHFLLANDDTFVNRPLSKDFFFEDGKPIVRMRPAKINTNSLYQVQLLHSLELIEQAFSTNVQPFSARNSVPHHNIDAYLKSDYADCAQYFEKEYKETQTHRFRKPNCVHRLIVSVWSVMKKHAQVRVIYSAKKQRQNLDSVYIKNTQKNYAKTLALKNPGLFCINDTEFSGPEDRMRLKEFLQKRFPKKSQFEL